MDTAAPATLLVPSLRLDGRSAIVTGAGRGIGREISRVLAAAGAHVVAADIDLTAARSTADQIKVEGGISEARAVDVTDSTQVDSLASDLGKGNPPVQIIVNNAGIVTMAPFLELPESEFDAVLAVSLRGTYLMTRAFLPAMRDSEWGRVISMSSMLGKTPVGYAAHYSAAKAGIIAFTQSIAKEAAPYVTVNCLCPTNVETGIIDADIKFFGEREGIDAETLIKRWVDAIPMGRLGRPIDVAWAVLILASEAGAFTTGQAINVSGGEEVH